MTLSAPTRQQQAERALQFLQRGMVRRGVPLMVAQAATSTGSERWLTVQAFAQGMEVVLANNLVLEDEAMPDTATGENLERICAVYGLERGPGAGAQGPVEVICTGTVTYAIGAQLVSKKTKKRYEVVATVSVGNGDPVDIVGIDRGTDTNLDPGEELEWTSPPEGSALLCKVGSGGLVDGQDPDDDERLRAKLFKLLQEPQNGGSWAHFRQWAEEASAAVEAGWIYPAVQGPGTVHVAYTIRGTPENRYSRIGTKALTRLVANNVVAEAPAFADVLTTPVGHENLSLALRLSLPEPLLGGGPGGGWVDPVSTRWPTLKIGAGNLDGVPTVTSCTTTSLVCSAYATPTAGTSVLIFTATDRRAHLAKVASVVGGSAGAWLVTLDRAIPTMATGDYVAPACEQGVAYAETFQARVALLAPGEKTDEAAVLPRGYRHPAVSSTTVAPLGPSTRSGLTTLELTSLQTTHPEIVSATYFAAQGVVGVVLPLEPSTPFLVTNPPLVLRVKYLAFYP